MFLLERIDHTIKKVKSQTANALTLLNLSFGILAIIFSIHEHYNISLTLIFLAALSDRFDGMVARRFDIVSEFGKQLDSLCDLISFGIAPSLLIYHSILSESITIGSVAVVIYIVCASIRLARFNVQENTSYFIGIPITLAGILLTFSYLFTNVISSVAYLYIMVILGILMISPFKLKKI